MYNILKAALYEFPIEQIKVNMPEWIAILAPDHYLKKEKRDIKAKLYYYRYTNIVSNYRSAT